jgi:hypothetical protein
MRQLLINVLLIEESKRRLTMAEITVKAIFFFGLYVPMYIYTLVVTFADVRFWILTALAVITGSWRFVRWLRRDDRKNEALMIDNEMKRLEQREKEIELRERDLDIMERENNIIKRVGL